MNKLDLVKVYAFAGAIWSSFRIPTNEIEAKIFDETWFLILRPYSLEMVLTAVQEHAKKSDFCNIAKIGDICETYTKKLNGNYIDTESVIDEIKKAISYYDVKEKFEKLSPFAKEVVGDPSNLAKWSIGESKDFETVIISQLRKRLNNKLEEIKINETLGITSKSKVLIEDIK